MTATNSLTNAIIYYVTILGGCAVRVNVQGVPIHGQPGKFRPSPNRGYEDLDICIKGRKIAGEIKTGKDVQSVWQKERQSQLERAGGVYLIIKNFDDGKAQIDKIVSEIK